MINRKEEIKKKSFDMIGIEDTAESMSLDSQNIRDFSKIKVGLKILDDAIVDLNHYKRTNPRLGDKKEVLRAISENNYELMREISNFFYRTSGIYSRLCRYMAYLYRYDWLLTPYIISSAIRKEKIIDEFNKALLYLDNFEIKKYLGEVSLKVIRNGCYYGYLIQNKDRMVVQELPPKYCRSRYMVDNKPAIEFNMRFFDEEYPDQIQRTKVLNLFPKEFKKGYMKYKKGELPIDFMGDTSGWYLLETKNVIKFNMNDEDFPAFISVIPAIIDLDEAQALDKKKMQQQLLKIIIQKMPIDKNGDLIFDVEEAQELHNNAVRMLGKAIGIDILTTFAEVEVADIADKRATTGADELKKVERSVYNEAGVSQMQFNTNGNIALEKSILNDEASMSNLLAQFERFLNDILDPFNKNRRKLYYRVQLLPTTIYNYKEMAKLYKEQATIGYSKMLPQIALGQSQSSILANSYFENDILNLVESFVPLKSSNTMSSNISNNKEGEEKKSGRKELDDDKKSDKTIKNRESMN